MIKKRIAFGVIREAYILGEPLIIEGHGTKHFDIIEESSGYSNDCKIKIFLKKFQSKYKFKVFLGNNIFFGTLSRGKNNLFTLIDLNSAEDPRESARFQSENGKKPYAELLGAGLRMSGLLEDWSNDYLRILCTEVQSTFSVGDVLTTIITDSNGHIFKNKQTVVLIRKRHNGIEYILGAIQRNSTTPTIHRVREKIDLRINARWPNSNGAQLNIALENLSSLGFGGKWIGKTRIPVGALITFDQGFTAQLLWTDGNKCGFYLGDSSRINLGSFIRFCDLSNGKSLSRLSTTGRKEALLRLALRSGYLTGRKAEDFKKNRHLVDLLPTFEQEGLWLRRFFSYGDKEDVVAHVSFLRIADTGIFIQEVSSSDENNTTDGLLLDSLKEISTLECRFLSLNTAMCALYDPISKFNRTFWTSVSNKFQAHTIDVSIHSLEESKNISTEIVGINVEQKIWKEIYSALSQHYDLRLLSALGLTEVEYRSTSLKEELFQARLMLGRRISAIADTNGLYALLLNLGLPIYSNTRYTPSTHLWVLPLRDHFDSNLLNSPSIKTSFTANGSREALLINSVKSKNFKFICWNIHDSKN